MESSGKPGMVHISEKTYSFLEEEYYVQKAEDLEGNDHSDEHCVDQQCTFPFSDLLKRPTFSSFIEIWQITCFGKCVDHCGQMYLK